MGNRWGHALYQEDVVYGAGLSLPWEKLRGKKLLVTGPSGLIGSFFIDVVMEKNRELGLGCKVYGMGRDGEAARRRFSMYQGSPWFDFLVHDINRPLEGVTDEEFGFIVHLASNTHPVAYAQSPISTITTNMIGTNHLLRYGASHPGGRFVFASSNEIYGENRGDVEFFDESYCGYLDCNTLRGGYPESKRCGEALCQAYRKEKGIDVVIPRFTRTYGPTMRLSDTKAISQFIRKGIAGEDIVLKSQGNQYYSYTYMADGVTGLLTAMFLGESGSAYNIADEKSDITLKELAGAIADLCGTKVVYEVPDEVEKSGYSTATKARLDGSRIKGLGWTMKYDIPAGISRTITILRSMAL